MIKNSIYYCRNISPDDKSVINEFELANEQGGFLSIYLKRYALDDEKTGAARTYLILDKASNELVAYFSLKAGFISSGEHGILLRKFDTIPGVEVSNFAVNGKYIEAHPHRKGTGKLIFNDFIIPTIVEASMVIGISFIYIFALPQKELVEHYKEYGFIRLNKMQEMRIHRRIRPRYDTGCVFMYQKL